ncbi:MAG: superinfection immunity protein [Emcibacter sp.]|nr:superinfection immunity protein [Emcibacter sp.]
MSKKYKTEFKVKKEKTMDSKILMLLVAMVGFTIYFIPTIVAAIRNHPNVVAISLLNIFLGWTFLGWVGALIWSATNIASSDNK